MKIKIMNTFLSFRLKMPKNFNPSKPITEIENFKKGVEN